MKSIGIVGLPNAGKSTLFTALTEKEAESAPYAFTTLEPNVARVPIPDGTLRNIAGIIRPEKVTPALIEFVDIAGLVRGAHKGEGLGNQFLSHIAACDAILHVVRCFEDENIEHTENSVNPSRDITIIQEELAQKQLDNKPAVYILNRNTASTTPTDIAVPEHAETITADLKLIGEAGELSEEERREMDIAPVLDRVVTACYNALALVRFYTVAGGKEVRAWAAESGTTALEAAGMVHSDFREQFKKALAVPAETLIGAGSWSAAKEDGNIRTVAKDYQIQEGDVLEFRI